MLDKKLAFALHKAGVYGFLESARDFAQLAQANRAKSLSQFKEDLFVSEYFGTRKGVYIDIGANHPFRLSNTYLLYRQGWSGAIVEPIRGLCAKHKQFRPRDIQLNMGASDSSGTLTFYEMVPSVLSTCSAEEADALLSKGTALLLNKYEVPVMTVDELYSKYLAPRPVSLLTIDTEGRDLQVLRGINWETLRPELIICEANDPVSGVAVTELLAQQGYQFLQDFGCNKIFGLR